MKNHDDSDIAYGFLWVLLAILIFLGVMILTFLAVKNDDDQSQSPATSVAVSDP